MSAAPIFTDDETLPEVGESPGLSSSRPGSGPDAFPLACRGRELPAEARR